MDFMNEALNEARKAYEKGEVPVGAVIVKDNKIIARGHNLKESSNQVIDHAEIIAIRQANNILNNWRLNECELYVTLEPCPMCAAAIMQSRIRRIHIGTIDPVAGACGSVINLVQNDNLNYFIDVNWTYNQQCSEILVNFFEKKRKK